jgi:hypothetical protein
MGAPGRPGAPAFLFGYTLGTQAVRKASVPGAEVVEMTEHPSFSAHVAKESIAAVVRTADQLIVGQVHARPSKRLKDEMNHVSDRFIAITDARVYDSSGSRLLFETAFILVSNAHIVSIAPVSAVTMFGEVPWASDALAGDPATLKPRPIDRVS